MGRMYRGSGGKVWLSVHGNRLWSKSHSVPSVWMCVSAGLLRILWSTTLVKTARTQVGLLADSQEREHVGDLGEAVKNGPEVLSNPGSLWRSSFHPVFRLLLLSS